LAGIGAPLEIQLLGSFVKAHSGRCICGRPGFRRFLVGQTPRWRRAESIAASMGLSCFFWSARSVAWRRRLQFDTFLEAIRKTLRGRREVRLFFPPSNPGAGDLSAPQQ
jgi:hypothetical protein